MPPTPENTIHDTTSPIEKTPKTGLEISVSGPNEALNNLNALADALNHDKPITTESITKLRESLKGTKIKLGNQEVTVEQAEHIYGSFTSFLKETWKIWGVDEEKIKDTQISVEIKNPKDEDYSERKADIDPDKFGQFTLNPDTQGLDWEALKDKIFIPDPKEFEDCSTVQDVANRLIEKYSDKYKIPGIEYWKFMLENPDKVPDQLKDGNWYFNFGSLVRLSDGSWYLPYAGWNGAGWLRGAGWLDDEWDSSCRVVLLEI
ncbi:MAG: hypothetical protein WC237_01625 [Candidatus Paceibacterota bacterium]|jgi:hypothetical protein